MTTILKIEEVPQDLATLIHRMRERREAVVIKDGEGPLAYLTLAFRPDPKEVGVEGCEEGKPLERKGPRVVYNPRTGLPVVTARPGARMVTAEEIYEELRGSGP
jgi:hypothetical protein